MLRIAGTGMMVVAALLLAGASAEAGGKRASKAWRAERPPIKDCTKFNGRWGYYGNPYCTPAEQERFDRWQARNLYR